MDYIQPPEDNIITFGPEEVQLVRRECNLDKKEDRETSISIIQEWIKEQDHFVKKDFNKRYIESVLILSKGSLERAKKQIDKLCTIRTLMPQYFETTNIKNNNEIVTTLNKMYGTLLPKMTKECYRIFINKLKPKQILYASDYSAIYKYMCLIAEYIRANDYCLGNMLILDIYDVSLPDAINGIDVLELKQILQVLTGMGIRIKCIYLVTNSKLIEGFLNFLRPFFPAKIRDRIHAIKERHLLKNIIDEDILPLEYGGNEKSIVELCEHFIESMAKPRVQDLLTEMSKAVTDESKRQSVKFNEQYLGMPGTFRYLNVE